MTLAKLDRYDKFILSYYLATPVFLAVDVVLNWSFRASFLDSWPVLKYGYYLVCFLFGLGILGFPGSAATIGLLESVVNIVMLVLGVIVPIFDSIAVLADITPAAGVPVYRFSLVNFVLTGTMLLVSFYRNPLVRYGKELR
jgi:hypothetical protein